MTAKLDQSSLRPIRWNRKRELAEAAEAAEPRLSGSRYSLRRMLMGGNQVRSFFLFQKWPVVFRSAASVNS
jgi:hypothetical protein